LNTSFLLANIVFDAYRTSSGFNKFVVVVLFILSVYTLANMFGKGGALKIIDRKNQKLLRQLRTKPHPAQLYLEVQGRFAPGIPMADVYAAAIKEMLSLLRKRGVLEADVAGWSAGLAPVALTESEIDAIRSCAESELEEQLIVIEEKMSSLAACTSTAPSIGLFGTVWGIMNAFRGIGARGSATLAVVAPGISEALIATAFGLAAAIPAVVFYNYYLNRIRAISLEMDNFASEFLNIVERHYLQR